MAPGPERIRLSAPLVRAMLALVALVSQLTLGGLLLPDEAAGAVARLHAATAFCAGAAREAGAARRPDTPARHQHHPNDAATCPIESALELPAVILMPAIVLPSLAVSSGRGLFTLPPARGPPAALAWALHARGPPHPT